jgi:hypothetical protein
MSQNQPDVPLFLLDQDCLTIDKLSALETGLGITAEPRINASKTTYEIGDKNRIEEQFIYLQVFHRTSGERV